MRFDLDSRTRSASSPHQNVDDVAQLVGGEDALSMQHGHHVRGNDPDVAERINEMIVSHSVAGPAQGDARLNSR